MSSASPPSRQLLRVGAVEAQVSMPTSVAVANELSGSRSVVVQVNAAPSSVDSHRSVRWLHASSSGHAASGPQS